MSKHGSGWRKESHRHRLAGMGISTKPIIFSSSGIVNETMISKAKAEFGVTEDFDEAGYILPDGEMLDFSGKNQGAIGRDREVDHREINVV